VAREAAPVLRDLDPAAGALRPALSDTAALAPDAQRLFEGLDPVITASRTALPAATRLLRAAQPLVDILLPVSLDLSPAVSYLRSQQDQLVAAIANVATVLNHAIPPAGGGSPIHYLRAITYFSQEGFVGYRQRLPSNRRNPYLRNRGLDDVKPGSAIRTYDCDNLGNADESPEPEAPPPCVTQAPYAASLGGGMFPHVTRDPLPAP
jgi:hypothetical protein